MAAMARTAADVRALEALGERFDALAERRKGEDRAAQEAAEALARRLIEAEERTTTPASDVPLGSPSPEALQMATDAIGRHYVAADATEHQAIRSACMRLAYTFMAYGLVPKQPVAQQRIEEKPSRVGRHILLVDDVADVLVSVGAFLVNAGYAVRKAANGDEALRIIAGDPQIEVLITDFAMPGLNGAELIAQARDVRPNLKALMITAYPNADGLAELPPHTMTLVKPFRRAALLAGVNSLLGVTEPSVKETLER